MVPGRDQGHSVWVCSNSLSSSINTCFLLSAQCPVLQDPDNGMVTTTSRRLRGSTATYTCNSGYQLLNGTPGSDVSTCQPDGTWSGSEFQCVGMLVSS